MTFRWRLTLTFALVFLLGALGISAGVLRRDQSQPTGFAG